VSVPERNKCKFYRYTALGARCVLLSPEEWRKRKDALKRFCMSKGRGCSVLMLYLRKNFKNDISKKSLDGRF